ncbi:putative cellulose synthase-like protein H3 isoform X1 [Oryza brachyantha]|uniref:putative cellulose synthase-like protein H3 isoform X1 n=1 Tax=Oryza brachyantha TaxID=4533 RepID=UPI001ADCD5E0|nr:putative cellulose synthase-like protein H3 isoform X1 [Oryza brachyantha]
MAAAVVGGGMRRKLQERVPLRRTALLADFVVLFLFVALLARRVAGLDGGGAAWRVALACEAWFAFVWLLNMNAKWNPVRFDTYPENLAERIDELLAVDMFVTTADPVLEPPMVTVNTVLSLLAVDYPAADEKLACYVHDDACSPLTCYALREAASFARLWVPFCRRHGVAVRAPFRYFSSTPELGTAGGNEFLDDWAFIKREYEKLVRRVEDADESTLLRQGDGEFFAEFMDVERTNHPAIVKILWDNSKSRAGERFPHLIYVSREKSPSHHHYYKAGAMNVLARVSAVMTNAPITLNVDCDMFANNPQVVLHAMCVLLGFDDEIYSGFVQAPRKLYGTLKDDPFGTQQEVIYKTLGSGMAGIWCTFYNGSGCFHRRKAIYGATPNSSIGARREGTTDSLPPKEFENKFGSSEELKESITSILSGNLPVEPIVDISCRVEAAKEVATCKYESGTRWGREVGWVYGSMTEDILTGQRIHAAGWRSVLLETEPPAFMCAAPIGGPACLTQFKRWATGLFEIIISRNNPILMTVFRRLRLRQCLSYLSIYAWPVRGFIELCYALLPPYCILTNQSFLPKAPQDVFGIPLALFLTYNTYSYMEYKKCGLSVHAWWNNHKMQRITSASAWLLGFLTVLLKTVGLSEAVFEVTPKEKITSDGNGGGNDDDDDDKVDLDLGRFTFDASPVFIPVTALAMLNILAVAAGAWRACFGTAQDDLPGVSEFMACGWMLLCFLPFVRGLVGKGRYGIPWSVKLKASLLVAMFVLLCRGK